MKLISALEKLTKLDDKIEIVGLSGQRLMVAKNYFMCNNNSVRTKGD